MITYGKSKFATTLRIRTRSPSCCSGIHMYLLRLLRSESLSQVPSLKGRRPYNIAEANLRNIDPLLLYVCTP